MIHKWYFDRGVSHLAFFKPFLNTFLLNLYSIKLIGVNAPINPFLPFNPKSMSDDFNNSEKHLAREKGNLIANNLNFFSLSFSMGQETQELKYEQFLGHCYHSLLEKLLKSVGSDIIHHGTLNLSDLMISLWHGTIDCTKPNDKSTWTWAVLQGGVWQQHGKAVANVLNYRPSSFNPP